MVSSNEDKDTDRAEEPQANKTSVGTNPTTAQSLTSGFQDKQTRENYNLFVETLQPPVLCCGSPSTLVYRCQGSFKAIKKRSTQAGVCLSSHIPCNSWTFLTVGLHTDLKKQQTAPQSTPLVSRSNPLGHKTHLYPQEGLLCQGESGACFMDSGLNSGGRNTNPIQTVNQRALCVEQAGSVCGWEDLSTLTECSKALKGQLSHRRKNHRPPIPPSSCVK